MTKKSLARTRIIALAVVLSAILYFWVNVFSPRFMPSFLRIGTLQRPINLLIVGTDTTFDSVTRKALTKTEGRTDSILLAHIDPARSRINILSIPRDTLVNIPGYYPQKINAANVYGGMDLTKTVVQNLTGQKVDYYIKVKPAIIVDLANLVGGVTLYVEKDMRYVDHAQGLDINLKEGWHKLWGKEAHDYIRFRHDAFGDIGRIDRQQKFLKALVKKAATPSNIMKSPIIIGVVLKEIETDMPLSTNVRVLNLFRMLSFDNIKTATISGEAATVPGAGSVWLVNQSDLQQTIKELF
ncbi:MAG: LCP family protein [Candidatus Margulisiibacteriota bacterium]